MIKNNSAKTNRHCSVGLYKRQIDQCDKILDLLTVNTFYGIENTQGLLLVIDFEIGFDTFEWSFVRKAFIRSGVGEPAICLVINTFYDDTESCVLNVTVDGDLSGDVRSLKTATFKSFL